MGLSPTTERRMGIVDVDDCVNGALAGCARGWSTVSGW